MSNSVQILQIPEDVVVYLCCFFDLPSLSSFAQTCKWSNHIFCKESLWKQRSESLGLLSDYLQLPNGISAIEKFKEISSVVEWDRTDCSSALVIENKDKTLCRPSGSGSNPSCRAVCGSWKCW